MLKTSAKLIVAIARPEVAELRVAAEQLTALAALDEFERELAALTPEITQNLCVIDFQRVTFMVTPAINALLTLHRLMKNRGGRLVLVGLSDPIRRVFELTKLDQTFEIADSAETVIAAAV